MSSERRPAKRRHLAVTILGGIGGTLLVGLVVLRHRADFVHALHAAPALVLAAAVALQVVALLARTEAWHQCVCAAGGTLARRRLYRAAGIGYLGSQLNSQLGAAARIAALRRTSPAACPRVPALIAAEVPILAIEAALAAGASFTLVGPLGLPWWLPLVFLGAALLAATGLRWLAARSREGFWSGLSLLRSLHGRNKTIGLVLIAVFAQIARNWMMLDAVGVPASVFDATAVLIAMVTLSQLPAGPSVGAGAVVLILGAGGVAAAAAAGVLLTATGAAGALCYVIWAATDTALGRRAARRAGLLVAPIAMPVIATAAAGTPSPSGSRV